MRATKDHYYKGYLIEKPEGCDYWNIHKIDEDGLPDWCFSQGSAQTLKEARETVEDIIRYGA